jgi:hypothetical protein
MKVQTVKVLITLGAMAKIPRDVWPWEVPVLEEQHGGMCEVAGDGHIKEVESLPDAGEEFTRLGNCCGIEPESKIPNVENAYGRGQSGVKALAKAIKEAGKGPKPKVTKKKATKKAAAKKPKPVEEPVVEDPFSDEAA